MVSVCFVFVYFSDFFFFELKRYILGHSSHFIYTSETGLTEIFIQSPSLQ